MQLRPIEGKGFSPASEDGPSFLHPALESNAITAELPSSSAESIQSLPCALADSGPRSQWFVVAD
jgi:hypothetical protein